MKGDPYLDAVWQVVHDREPIKTSITKERPALLALRKTSACQSCMGCIAQHSASNHRRSEKDEECRGLRLMFIMAALQNPDEHDQREQLCLLGTRGVDAYENLRPERRRKAALARERPLKDMPWYVEQHLPWVVSKLAGNLEALVENPELLEDALQAQGRQAMVKYFC